MDWLDWTSGNTCRKKDGTANCCDHLRLCQRKKNVLEFRMQVFVCLNTFLLYRRIPVHQPSKQKSAVSNKKLNRILHCRGGRMKLEKIIFLASIWKTHEKSRWLQRERYIMKSLPQALLLSFLD